MNKKGLILLSLVICLLLTSGCSLFSNLTKYSISGQVTFPDGIGVKGVKITLTTGETKIVETDAEGRWSLDKIKGEVTLTPAKEGYTFQPSNLKVKATGKSYNFICTYAIEGQVLFNNQALSDVNISFSPESLAVKTDTLGNWRKEGLFSEVIITPTKAGYYFIPSSTKVTDYTTDIVFQAGQTYCASGQTTDIDGEGIAGVTIEIGNTNKAVSTDANGAWSVSELVGEVILTPKKDGYIFIPENYTVHNEEENIAFLGIRLDEYYSVSGHVLDLQGQGVGGVVLNFGDSFETVTTDATGMWSKEGLYGEVQVIPTKTGYTFTPTSTNIAGHATDIDFVGVFDGERYTASGHVVDFHGQEMEGVVLNFGGSFEAVTTDATGIWSKEGLYGDIQIIPSKTGYTFEPVSINITGSATDINFVGVLDSERYSVSGKVIDIHGQGAEGVVLNFGGSFEAVTTDATGAWSKEGLYGEVQITPIKTGYTFEPASTNIAGDATDIDFVGVLNSEYYTASGQVVDINGQGISGVQVDFGPKFGVVTTDNNGAWIRDNLYLQVQITPSKEGYFFKPEKISITEDSSNLAFLGVRNDEVYSITGKVVDPVGVGLVGVTIDLGSFGSVLTDADGMWSKADVYGKVIVTPIKESFTFEPATLETSMELNNLTFTGTYTASGQIFDSKGVGLTGVTLNFGPEFQTVVTNSEGYWEKSGLYGDIVVTPDKANYIFEPASYSLHAAGQSKVNFIGYQLYTVSGTVVSPGNYNQPLSNVTISVGNTSMKTDQTGEWSYTWREGSTITVHPIKTFWTFEPATKAFSKSEENFVFEAYPNMSYFTLYYPNLFTTNLADAYYSGSIKIELRVEDNDNLLSNNEIKFYVDDVVFDTFNQWTISNYYKSCSTQLNTAELSEGSHILRIEIITEDAIIPIEDEIMIRHLHPSFYYDASNNISSCGVRKYENGAEEFAEDATVTVNNISFIPDLTKKKYYPEDGTFSAMEGEELTISVEHPSYNTIIESVTVPYTTDSLQSSDLQAWIDGGPDAELTLTWDLPMEQSAEAELKMNFYDINGYLMGGRGLSIYGDTSESIRRSDIYIENVAYVEIYLQFRNIKPCVSIGAEWGCTTYNIGAVNNSNVLTNLPEEFLPKSSLNGAKEGDSYFDNFVKSEYR